MPNQPFTRFSSYLIINDIASYKCRDVLSLIDSALISADLSDEKAVPARGLRGGVTIPENSELWFDADVFNEIFVKGDCGEVFSWDSELVDGERAIGGVKIKGVEFDFTYSELALLVLTTDKEDFLGFEEATLEIKTKLLCMLYARRFPFDGDDLA